MDVYDPNDLSIVEYMRYHGLSCDPDLDSDEDGDVNLFATFQPESSTVQHDMNDGSNSNVDYDFMNEAFTIDSKAKEFLASVFALRKPLPRDKVNLDVRRSKYLRVEEPLLLTDLELDDKECRKSRQAAEADFEVESTLWPVHEDQDEGLSWPAGFDHLPAQFDKQAKEEKLEVTKEAIEPLKQIRTGQYGQPEITKGYEADEGYKRYKAKRAATAAVTPPLSPIIISAPSPQTSSPLPDLGSALWNHDTTPMTSPSKEYVDKLMEEDDISPATIDLDGLHELYPALKEKFQPELPSSPLLRRRTNKLKVEPPMSQVKDVPQSDDLPLWTLPRWETVAPSSDADLCKIFEDIIEPAAYQVQQDLNNEQFNKADVIVRIEVPKMADITPVQAPWEEDYTEEDEFRELQQLMLPIAQASLHHWSVSKLENQLPWSVLPANYQDPKLDEDIDDPHGLVEQFIKLDLSQRVNRDTLTWKPEGLRILDPDSDDELPEYDDESASLQDELQVPADPPLPLVTVKPVDTNPVVILQPPRSDPGPFNMPVSFFPLSRKLASEHDHPSPNTPPKTKRSSDKTLDFSSLLKPSSATTARPANEELDRFMVMQGKSPKRRKLEHIVATPPSPPLQPTHNTPLTKSPPRQVARPSNLPPRRVIASSALISNIPLFRNLTRIYPDLDVTEGRDISSTDPDLIISPTSCLVLEPLAKLHQLPLPGEVGSGMPGHSLHAKITTLAQRYNHISVLITTSGGRLDSRDEKAVETLMELARGLKGPEASVVVEVRCVDSSVGMVAMEIAAVVAGR